LITQIAYRLLSFYRSRIKITSLAQGAAVAVSWIRYAHLLLPLLLSERGSKLNNYLRARPEVLAMVYGPYLAANWDATKKIRTVISHIETVAEIGGIVDIPPDTVLDLVDLSSLGAWYRITIDQPRWLLREGQLALSLWDGIDRIFSLSFSLSTKDGRRVAYIGGIQGRRQIAGESSILDRYRHFTKAAFGSRPRDFLVEVFKLFCRAINVTEIFAVSDSNYWLQNKGNDFTLSYDEIWKERGGTDSGDGFYILPLGPEREKENPASAIRKNRKRLFSEIEIQFAMQLSCDRAALARTSRVRRVQVKHSGTSSMMSDLTYVIALFGLAVLNYFGGSWIALALGLLLIQLTYWFLRGSLSYRGIRCIVTLERAKYWPLLARFFIGACFIAVVILIDIYSGGFSVGRAFLVYLIPIFAASLVLGKDIAVVAWLCCAIAFYYFDIPPRLTFEFESVDDLNQILIFAVLGGLALVTPKLEKSLNKQSS
jgi:uncharacterized protein VirK/YbjX